MSNTNTELPEEEKNRLEWLLSICEDAYYLFGQLDTPKFYGDQDGKETMQRIEAWEKEAFQVIEIVKEEVSMISPT